MDTLLSNNERLLPYINYASFFQKSFTIALPLKIITILLHITVLFIDGRINIYLLMKIQTLALMNAAVRKFCFDWKKKVPCLPSRDEKKKVN